MHGPGEGVATAKRSAVARLMRPRSIAIIGASPVVGSLGAAVLANIDRFAFAGDVHLVNPSRSEIAGRPCLPSAAALPLGVDCAVLAIPAAGVAAAAAQCAARGVGGLVIFSAGFAETGAEGRVKQDALAELAQTHGMAIEGPNCLGMINFVDGVPLTFSASQPAPLNGKRGLAVVSQSGAMAVVMRVALEAREIGITFSISTGNEALNGIEDFLAELIDDSATAAIAFVVEQFRTPRRFLKLLRQAQIRKLPVVLLHPGRSSAARTSAETHTGAMTGDWAVMRTLVTHAGCILVETLEELIDVAEFLVRFPVLPTAGPAVLTDSGAFKGQVLDYAESLALPLPGLTPETERRLIAVLPDFALASNPLDLTAQALVDPGVYRGTIVPFLEDPSFGSVVLAVILPSEATSRRKLPPIIDALAAMTLTKPVIFAMLGEDAPVPAELVRSFRDLGVSFMRSPERALRALAVIGAFMRRPTPARPIPLASGSPLDLPAGTIPEYAAKRILARLGVPVPAAEFVRDVAAAQRAAARIGYPVALKAQSALLSHKSDAGGVVLRLADAAAVEAGWTQLHDSIAAARPGLELDGVLVEAMGSPGVELILGVRNDPQWGPVVLVGLGGIWAEALQDVRLLPPDLAHDAICRELLQIKGAALLRGVRGSPKLDLDTVARIVTILGALALAAPQILEIDINPLVVFPNGAIALDALIVTDQ